jgi:hypothetical protein
MTVPTLESRDILLALLDHDATAECESTGCVECRMLREVLSLIERNLWHEREFRVGIAARRQPEMVACGEATEKG